MNLILTDPIIEDYVSFHSLICESDWQREFENFRGMTLLDTKNHIEYWVINKEVLFPQFYRMIKLTWEEELVNFNNLNSITIGFISFEEAASFDRIISGKTHLLNFAISEKYYGCKIMTNALEMTLERMNNLGYNNISAFVKEGNIASEKVLIKCGFRLELSTGIGNTYIKRF